MIKLHKYLNLLVMLLVFIGLNSVITFANSEEPPSLLIIVKNPTDDLTIVMTSNVHQPEAKMRKLAWEGYYIFYSRDMQSNDNYTFKVTTHEKSFECTFNQPLIHYSEVLTLDMSTQTLTYGAYPFRTVILVSIRVFLTLLIEGILFWLFQFRERRSWVVFFSINLLTQGALNIMMSMGPIISSYLIFGLIFGEVFVFISELIGFNLFIQEKSKNVVIIYVLIANFLSLIAGGYLITLLPV